MVTAVPQGAEDEREYEANLNIFLQCIATAGAREHGFAATKLTGLVKPEFLEKVTDILKAHGEQGLVAHLSPAELKRMEALNRRLHTMADHALKGRVRLMVDAEQTYFQPAIDHFVLTLQKKYNREFPVIFNTYQGYLRDALSRAKADLATAKKDGFIFAAKIVRGAYMIQERERATKRGYADPIQPNIEATHDSYNTIVKAVLSAEQPTELMVASHNEESVAQAVSFVGR